MDPQTISIIQALLQAVMQQYPVLAQHQPNVMLGQGPYFSEYFPPWEPDNPQGLGHPTIQIDQKGQQLPTPDISNLLAGENLHLLGAINPQTQQPVDPYWHAMKNLLIQQRSPQQVQVDQRAYQTTGDQRPFPQWMDQSRADQMIGGYMFPVGTDEWRKQHAYTPQQEDTMEGMRRYLQGLGPSRAE